MYDVVWRRLASCGKSLFRYGVAGGIGFLINVGGVYILEQHFSWRAERAFALTLTLAYVCNFVLARYYVFSSRSNVYRQVVLFLLVSLLFRGGEYFGFAAIHSAYPMPGAAIAMLVLGVSTIIKFTVYRFLVFV